MARKKNPSRSGHPERYWQSLQSHHHCGRHHSKFDTPPHPTDVIIETAESGLTQRSAVVLNQIRSIDRQRLTKRLGRLPADTMQRVDQALRISLGLVDIPLPESPQRTTKAISESPENLKTGRYEGPVD